MDTASQMFQLALQLAYLEMREEVDAVLAEGTFITDSGERLTRRALASYAAAAVIMPYSAFARAVEARRYDVEALARQFGASFEQTAHRLTTLQKPGQERVPFFFIRVDPAGNVSKRLDGAGFPSPGTAAAVRCGRCTRCSRRRARSSPSGWNCPTASGSSPLRGP
uniref:ImmA/IrrE family metallo-endopeptidase n=1 Tax=Phenylobacterium glaciei TaxID=2803784 RepID=A0A974P1G3_9CAUL|nr:ImmA/IrrE family metallo-endopeptidase [Phenylobacterium glaciei]